MSARTPIRGAKTRARKCYQCILCLLPILKGAMHVARRGTGLRGRITTRMHLDCEKVTRNWTECDWGQNSKAMMEGRA